MVLRTGQQREGMAAQAMICIVVAVGVAVLPPETSRTLSEVRLLLDRPPTIYVSISYGNKNSFIFTRTTTQTVF
jgi:hypothetical protein